MKRYKRLGFLAGVLAVLIVATVLLSHYEEKKEQIKNSNAVILQVSTDSVTQVQWSYESGDGLAFVKTDEGWQYTEDENFPVSTEKMEKLLGYFESYGVTFAIQNVDDYGQYGLEKPECTLCLTTETETITLKMGDLSQMDQQRYIDIGDGNVYLVEDDPTDYVSSDLSTMILHDTMPGFERVESVTFTGKENYTLTRVDDSADTYAPNEDIYFTQKDGKTVPLDTSTVRTYLNTMTGLSLLDYATYYATEEELEAFGMNDPVLTVTVDYSETDEEENTKHLSCTLTLGENQAERAASDQAVANGEDALTVTKYVRVGQSQLVYVISSTESAILEKAGYNDLRHGELFWADFDTVTRIDATLEGKTHTLTRQDGEDEDETVWLYGQTEISVTDLEDALYDLSAETFTDETPDKAQELQIVLTLDNENCPTVTLSLYRYDGESCLAVVDGQSVCLLSRSDVMTLVEAVQSIVLNG